MSSTSAGGPATRSIICLGMHVHKESIIITVLPESAKALTRVDQLPNDLGNLERWPAGSFCYPSSRLFRCSHHGPAVSSSARR